MTWADYIIVAIIGLSAFISVVRGFVREALSLLGWVFAIWFSLSFTRNAVAFIGERISVPSLRTAVAFLGLFVLCLLVAGVVNFLAGKLVEKSGLSGTDRMLGIIFGVARGAVIVGVLVLAAGLTALPQDPWWSESVLLGHFQVMAVEVRALLPPDVARHIKY